MNIPMNTKQPVRLEEMASAVHTKIQKPLPLNEIPQGRSARQPMGREQAVPSAQPVNRGHAIPPAQPVNRGHAIPPAQPVNRGHAVPPARPIGRMQPAQILPGVRPGQEMKKGQKASLMQKNPALTEIEVCLGWKVKNPMCDMDVSAFLLGADNKVPGEEWFVFYGQTESPDGSVIHHGDNRSSTGCGDMESIRIKLKRIHPNVKKIVFVITINEALKQGLNFGMVSDTYIRVVDKASNSEIVRYVLDEYYSNVTSMIVGEIYERNAEWKFNAVGNGVARDLVGLCELYGVQASY